MSSIKKTFLIVAEFSSTIPKGAFHQLSLPNPVSWINVKSSHKVNLLICVHWPNLFVTDDLSLFFFLIVQHTTTTPSSDTVSQHFVKQWLLHEQVKKSTFGGLRSWNMVLHIWWTSGTPDIESCPENLCLQVNFNWQHLFCIQSLFPCTFTSCLVAVLHNTKYLVMVMYWKLYGEENIRACVKTDPVITFSIKMCFFWITGCQVPPSKQNTQVLDTKNWRPVT